MAVFSNEETSHSDAAVKSRCGNGLLRDTIYANHATFPYCTRPQAGMSGAGGYTLAISLSRSTTSLPGSLPSSCPIPPPPYGLCYSFSIFRGFPLLVHNWVSTLFLIPKFTLFTPLLDKLSPTVVVGLTIPGPVHPAIGSREARPTLLDGSGFHHLRVFLELAFLR